MSRIVAKGAEPGGFHVGLSRHTRPRPAAGSWTSSGRHRAASEGSAAAAHALRMSMITTQSR